jgi:hypothetical protein
MFLLSFLFFDNNNTIHTTPPLRCFWPITKPLFITPFFRALYSAFAQFHENFMRVQSNKKKTDPILHVAARFVRCFLSIGNAEFQRRHIDKRHCRAGNHTVVPLTPQNRSPVSSLLLPFSFNYYFNLKWPLTKMVHVYCYPCSYSHFCFFKQDPFKWLLYNFLTSLSPTTNRCKVRRFLIL